MVSNLQLGDWYYTKDNYDDIAGFLFVARQGGFIIGVSEYMEYAGCIVEQLHEMCEETLESHGVEMFVHHADKCYATLEEAEKEVEEE